MNAPSGRACSTPAAGAGWPDRAIATTPAALNALYERAAEVVLHNEWPPMAEFYVLEGTLGALGERFSGIHYDVPLDGHDGPPTLLKLRADLLGERIRAGDAVRVVGCIRPKVYKLTLRFSLEVFEISCAEARGAAPPPGRPTLADVQAMRGDRWPFPFKQRLRVAVIYPRSGQVLEDFAGELKSAGGLVEVEEIAVAVAQASEIAAAIEQARGDVVALIRGGGDGADLRVFDSPPVLQAMAAKPCFRLTGIGHTGDRPLVDLVADHAARTPTAAGRFICDQLEARSAFVRRQEHEARRLADDRVRQATDAIERERCATADRLADAQAQLGLAKGLLASRLAAPGIDAGRVEGLVAQLHELRWQRRVLAGLSVALVVALTVCVMRLLAAPRAPAHGLGAQDFRQVPR